MGDQNSAGNIAPAKVNTPAEPAPAGVVKVPNPGRFRSARRPASPLAFSSARPILEPSHPGAWFGPGSWLYQRYRQLISEPAVQFALTIYLAHRLLLSALGALFAVILPVEPPLGASLLQQVSPRFWGPAFFLMAPWQRWDTNWYIRIAHLGYDVGTGTTNFPPLYPFLVGLVGRLLAGQYLLAALLISNLAYIVALIYLYRLTQRLFNERTAQKTLLFLATFPSAFFLACGYTESLYLALALAAFYYAEEKRWYLAAALAALAGITRIQGIVLVAPLGYLYLQQLGFRWRKPSREELLRGLALALSPVLFGLYMGWVYFGLGDQNFGNHLAVIWHIKFVMPWESLVGGYLGLFDPAHMKGLFYNALDFITLILFLGLAIIWLQRRLPRAYLLYTGLSLLLYLTRQGTEDIFWMSMNRYLVLIFPAFMLLGQSVPRFWLKLGGLVQAVWVVLFIFWMWAG